MKLHIGTSGWSFNHWIGKFYPKELPKKDWLEFYATQFDTVEMNMSFHRFPTKELISTWKEKLPKNFIMATKANRKITHIDRFRAPDNFLNDFYESVSVLGDNLGCVLFQAPPFFKFTDEHLERLKKFFKKLDRKKKNVFEFRHESWWNKKVFDLFKKEKLAFVSVSGFNLPENIIKTSSIVYIRFHGKKAFTSLYSNEEIKKWATAIKKIKAKEIYCYFNNDYRGYAVRNAKELKNELRR